jgi:hypothetical protein
MHTNGQKGRLDSFFTQSALRTPLCYTKGLFRESPSKIIQGETYLAEMAGITTEERKMK